MSLPCQPITGCAQIDSPTGACVTNNQFVDADGEATHGAYVSAVATQVSALRALGQLTKNAGAACVTAAAQSSVNK